MVPLSTVSWSSAAGQIRTFHADGVMFISTFAISAFLLQIIDYSTANNRLFHSGTCRNAFVYAIIGDVHTWRHASLYILLLYPETREV